MQFSYSPLIAQMSSSFSDSRTVELALLGYECVECVWYRVVKLSLSQNKVECVWYRVVKSSLSQNKVGWGLGLDFTGYV